MKISCHCIDCGARFSIPEEYAGRTGRCSQCGGRVPVPKMAEIEGQAFDRAEKATPAFTGNITTQCPICKKEYTTERSNIGKISKCSLCGHQFEVQAYNLGRFDPSRPPSANPFMQGLDFEKIMKNYPSRDGKPESERFRYRKRNPAIFLLYFLLLAIIGIPIGYVIKNYKEKRFLRSAEVKIAASNYQGAVADLEKYLSVRPNDKINKMLYIDLKSKIGDDDTAYSSLLSLLMEEFDANKPLNRQVVNFAVKQIKEFIVRLNDAIDEKIKTPGSRFQLADYDRLYSYYDTYLMLFGKMKQSTFTNRFYLDKYEFWSSIMFPYNLTTVKMAAAFWQGDTRTQLMNILDKELPASKYTLAAEERKARYMMLARMLADSASRFCGAENWSKASEFYQDALRVQLLANDEKYNSLSVRYHYEQIQCVRRHNEDLAKHLLSKLEQMIPDYQSRMEQAPKMMNELAQNLTGEARSEKFDQASRLFEAGDYLEAILKFQGYIENCIQTGTSDSDIDIASAHFNIACALYNYGLYTNSAETFEMIKTKYPNYKSSTIDAMIQKARSLAEGEKV